MLYLCDLSSCCVVESSIFEKLVFSSDGRYADLVVCSAWVCMFTSWSIDIKSLNMTRKLPTCVPWRQEG